MTLRPAYFQDPKPSSPTRRRRSPRSRRCQFQSFPAHNRSWRCSAPRCPPRPPPRARTTCYLTDPCEVPFLDPPQKGNPNHVIDPWASRHTTPHISPELKTQTGNKPETHSCRSSAHSTTEAVKAARRRYAPRHAAEEDCIRRSSPPAHPCRARASVRPLPPTDPVQTMLPTKVPARSRRPDPPPP